MTTTTTRAFLGWSESRDAHEEEDFYRARDKHWPGRVLFSRDSEFNGLVRVVQWGESWRSLDFNGISQGIAYVAPAPRDGGNVDVALAEVLGSQYLRVMASAAIGYAALNGRDPAGEGARFVFCGLGAGQLPHFLRHHFPNAAVQVAEICPVVVEANAVLRGGGAGGGSRCVGEGGGVDDHHSALLVDDNRNSVSGGNFDVVVADAAAFMSDTSDDAAITTITSSSSSPSSSVCRSDDEDDATDMVENPRGGVGGGGALAVFLDAYDGDGRVPDHLRTPAFLRSCAAQLAPGAGTVIANLYNGAPGTPARVEVERFAAALRRYVGPVVSLGVESTRGDNVVLVAGHATVGCDERRQRRRSTRGGGADVLEKKINVNGEEGGEKDARGGGSEDGGGRRRGGGDGGTGWDFSKGFGRNALGTASGKIGDAAGFSWSAKEAVAQLYWVQVAANWNEDKEEGEEDDEEESELTRFSFGEIPAIDDTGLDVDVDVNANGSTGGWFARAIGDILSDKDKVGGGVEGTASKTLYID